MNAQTQNHLAQPQQNPLAAIFFICGALHVYTAIKTKKRNNFQLLEIAVKMFAPLLKKILVGILFGTVFVEAIS